MDDQDAKQMGLAIRYDWLIAHYITLLCEHLERAWAVMDAAEKGTQEDERHRLDASSIIKAARDTPRWWIKATLTVIRRPGNLVLCTEFKRQFCRVWHRIFGGRIWKTVGGHKMHYPEDQEKVLTPLDLKWEAERAAERLEYLRDRRRAVREARRKRKALLK